MCVAPPDTLITPVEHRLVRILPVRAADHLPVLGLDVLGPDLVRVVDVRVAVEDREGLGDALLPVGDAHGAPPRAAGYAAPSAILFSAPQSGRSRPCPGDRARG